MKSEAMSLLGSSIADAPISTVVLGALFLILLLYVLVNTKPANYPPGPFGLPVIGNLLQLGSAPHIALTKLAKEYGPIFSLRLGSRDVVVLSSCDAVKEALGKNAYQFSGRPDVYSFQKNSNGGRSITFSDYGPRQALHKKCAIRILQTLFKNPERLNEFVHKEFESIKTLFILNGDKPFIANDFFRKEFIKLSFRLVFGDIDEWNEGLMDELYTLLDKARDFAENTPSSFLLDFMPWLHFALKKEASILENSVEDLFAFTRKAYKLRKKENKAETWCLAAELENIVQESSAHKLKETVTNMELETPFEAMPLHSAQLQQGKTKEQSLMMDDEDKIAVLTDIFGAGFETVAASLGWAVAFLLRNPVILKDLEDEIDLAVSELQLPSIKDKPNVPLLDAIILETLRICPAVPLALPHCTKEDTSVGGYSLPRGTMVLVNLWGVNHDPSYFHHADQFNPYRFLDQETGKIRHDLPRYMLPFAAGTRRCPGNTLAKAAMFLFLGGMLKLFRLEAYGRSPDLEGTFRFVLMPKAYKVLPSLRTKTANN